MGLFTGMSLLSVFEIFMWLLRSAYDGLCCRRRGKREAKVDHSKEGMTKQDKFGMQKA